MTIPQPPVDRFDRIWAGWAELTAKEDRIAQHREDRERFLRALKEAIPRLPLPCVLEVGCGSAIDLGLLARQTLGLTLVGLDISLAGLGVARAFARHLEARMAVCCGDVLALPLRAACAGLVFSQGLIEHFREPADAVREQARTLAPGGILVVSVPQTFTGYTLHKRRAMRDGTWPWGWEGDFTARRLARLGREQGLELLRVFGYQYWRSWGEPAWVLRDLWGKVQRRNPLAVAFPFPHITRLYDGAWNWLERWYGHLFLQNVVAVFRKPIGLP